jgi:hypothetical protein
MLSQVMVAAHIELLLALTKPGGYALLITDVARTETDVAGLSRAKDELPVSEVVPWISAERCFACLSPREIMQVINEEAWKPFVVSASESDFWTWQMGCAKYSRCWAVRLARSNATWHCVQQTTAGKLMRQFKDFSARTGIPVHPLNFSPPD